METQTQTSQTQAEGAAAGTGAQQQQTSTAADKTAASKTSTSEGTAQAGTQQNGKGATATQTDTTAELTYKLPDGVQENAEYFQGFKKILADQKLNASERAQALIDHHFAMTKKSQEAGAQAWEQQKTTWVNELKADKDFGGANYQANLDLANKAVLQFFGEPGVKWFAEWGRDPVVMKGLAALGKAAADDKIDRGTPAGGKDTSRLGELKSMFPNSQEMFERAKK